MPAPRIKQFHVWVKGQRAQTERIMEAKLKENAKWAYHLKYNVPLRTLDAMQIKKPKVEMI